jgi:hypothetical protein
VFEAVTLLRCVTEVPTGTVDVHKCDRGCICCSVLRLPSSAVRGRCIYLRSSLILPSFCVRIDELTIAHCPLVGPYSYDAVIQWEPSISLMRSCDVVCTLHHSHQTSTHDRTNQYVITSILLVILLYWLQ